MSESASVAIKLIRNLNSYNKAASTASTASARQNLDVLGSKNPVLESRHPCSS